MRISVLSKLIRKRKGCLAFPKRFIVLNVAGFMGAKIGDLGEICTINASFVCYIPPLCDKFIARMKLSEI